MSNVAIRSATEHDIDSLLLFEQGVVGEERPLNDSLKEGEVHYYDVAELVASEASMVLVAEVAGELVGTGHATIKKSLDYLEHDQHAYFGLMYVDPGFRRRGIIQSIIEELIVWSRGQGVSDYYLDVYSQNGPAIKAYEKLGFKPNLIEMSLHDK